MSILFALLLVLQKPLRAPRRRFGGVLPHDVRNRYITRRAHKAATGENKGLKLAVSNPIGSIN
jgi:hypothetical protein